MPQISIIIPIFNVEKYLRRCIDSILNQSFGDFELILVDDGSTDNCFEICEQYKVRDERVKVIHQKNEGLAVARNVGLRHAIGRYFLFCDSDDFVDVDWCKHMIEHTRPKQNNCIFCGIQTVYGEIEVIKKTSEKWIEYSISECFWLQKEKGLGFSVNILYYADVIRANNIFFPEDVIVEDFPFVLNYLKYMDAITYTGQMDYYYYLDDRETLSRKYYREGYRKWLGKYQISQRFITEYIPDYEQDNARKTLANMYLYPFLRVLENTWDKRNPASWREKIRYNTYVVNTSEFQECIFEANCEKENPLYMALLRKKRYLLVYLLQVIYKIKMNLFK